MLMNQKFLLAVVFTAASFALLHSGSLLFPVPELHARALQSADRGFCIKHIPALTSAVAVQITPAYIADPSCANADKVKSVCLFNESTSALSVSYIAASNTVDDNAGWPIFGSMDRCYDVGPNFKSWAFRGDTQPDAGFKVMYLK